MRSALYMYRILSPVSATLESFSLMDSPFTSYKVREDRTTGTPM